MLSGIKKRAGTLLASAAFGLASLSAAAEALPPAINQCEMDARTFCKWHWELQAWASEESCVKARMEQYCRETIEGGYEEA